MGGHPTKTSQTKCLKVGFGEKDCNSDATTSRRSNNRRNGSATGVLVITRNNQTVLRVKTHETTYANLEQGVLSLNP